MSDKRWHAGYLVSLSYPHPPIPTTAFDVCATFDDYSGERGDPIGHGPTDEAAIADLFIDAESRDYFEQHEPAPPAACPKCRGTGWIVCNQWGEYHGPGPKPEHFRGGALHDAPCDECTVFPAEHDL